MLSISLRKKLNAYYRSQGYRLDDISDDDFIFISAGRGLHHIDAYFLSKIAAINSEASEYISDLSRWVSDFYKVRAYYRRSSWKNETDHKSANPSGWAGPGMFPIALCMKSITSDGKKGGFVSAGVFKGGSAVSLTYPFLDLGITQYLADTFEGLPTTSTDGYYKPGQFRGSRDEVEAHMKAAGASAKAVYLQGLFSDTLHKIEEPIIGCFLDTDIYASSLSALNALKSYALSEMLIFSDGINPSRFATGNFAPQLDEERAVADFATQNGIEVSGIHTGYGNMGLFAYSEIKRPIIYSKTFTKGLFAVILARLIGLNTSRLFHDDIEERLRSRSIGLNIYETDPILELAVDALQAISYDRIKA